MATLKAQVAKLKQEKLELLSVLESTYRVVNAITISGPNKTCLFCGAKAGEKHLAADCFAAQVLKNVLYYLHSFNTIKAQLEVCDGCVYANQHAGEQELNSMDATQYFGSSYLIDCLYPFEFADIKGHFQYGVAQHECSLTCPYYKKKGEKGGSNNEAK